jgi:hypothetical protein
MCFAYVSLRVYRITGVRISFMVGMESRWWLGSSRACGLYSGAEWYIISIDENRQSCPTSIISYFESTALGNSAHYAARSSSGEFGTVEVTAALFSSTSWHSFLNWVAWFVTLFISGSYSLIIFHLFIHIVILPTIYVKENLILLYCFLSLQIFVSHTRVRWSAGASLLHIWVQSPYLQIGQDVPLIF